MPRQPILLASMLLLCPLRAGAQSLQLGAGAVGLATHAHPIAAGESRSGAYLTHPVITADAALLDGALTLRSMLNLEGATLRDGELAPGAWGEGFLDKRHPHTWLHELVATMSLEHAPFRGSLSAGRGFAPFGTDDPMARPFVRFPSNHHLAQLPERLIAIAAAGAGPVTVEIAAFNGDEPTDAGSLGSLDRFGDSWSARLTLRPRDGLELQGSYAAVESPEVSFGGGADQRKWSASARWQGMLADTRMQALAEWARTTDEDEGVALYGFRAWLLEGAAQRGAWRAALRYEDATRPEEERTADRFRSPRPHTDFHLLGITRWRTLLGRLGWTAEIQAMRLEPFTEVGVSRVDETAGGVLQPDVFFGGTYVTTLSAGVRIGIGHTHDRMGRYGVAAAERTSLLHGEH